MFGDGWTSSDLTAAAVRLEPFVGNRRIAVDHGRAWAAAAERALRLLDEKTGRGLLERADTLLRQIHATGFAASSPVLLSGFEARLEAFAVDLSAALGTPGVGDALAMLEASAGRVAQHEQAKAQKGRAERVTMAVRLVRWLATPETMSASFPDAVSAYGQDGAFVDRARLVLAGGDELAPLSAAYGALVSAIRDRRETQNETFAKLLRGWNAAPSAQWPLMPVERVLDAVVAPVAAAAPVLLLVMDGLSLAVYRELLPDLLASGWNELVPEGPGDPACAVAMLPTVTEISRSSLLCGLATRGTGSTEKTGFAQHPALRAAAKAGYPPVLFHKGDLSEGGALAPATRDAVGSLDRRVVGVVYNAIDDHLSGPQQVRQRWNLDNLQLLRPLLHEARNAGRVVVMTADHGHLIEAGSRKPGKEQGTGDEAAGGNSDRWRRADGQINAGEMEFTKARVLTPTNEDIAVLPWSEAIRYSMPKNGYHGGASPQEVLVPLAVLSTGGGLSGWVLAPPVQPDWWDAAPVATAVPAPSPRPASSKPTKKRVAAQPSLFDTPESANAVAEEGDWINLMLASPTYTAQRQLAARGAPKDDEVRQVLEALTQRGGKLSRTALAQRLSMPQIRIGTLLMAVRRVLNVDQARVLDVEEASGTVVLNRSLLDAQFELKTR